MCYSVSQKKYRLLCGSTELTKLLHGNIIIISFKMLADLCVQASLKAIAIAKLWVMKHFLLIYLFLLRPAGVTGQPASFPIDKSPSESCR